MATLKQPEDNDNTEQITPSTSKESSMNKASLFVPKDTCTFDQPCDDVILVVEDGKQFKADRKVLSEASAFFEKLLNSDMKESKEGIVRLEMLSESVMAASLEFIYTGHVQISTEDNARDLIVVADYLLLRKLKVLAEEVLAQNMNISNCISIYYFAETYQCEELLSNSKKFILANFTAVYAAYREDVLNMSRKEIEMWISSDEIDVSAEEDVLKIIQVWIEHDKEKRKKYFSELFRQVRLIYVSRDFLSSDVVTNDLVKENEDCVDLVKDAMSIIDSRSYDSLPVSPRKSFETPAIVTPYKNADFLCYFPDEDNWCRLGEIPYELDYTKFDTFFPCEGKLYHTQMKYSVNMVRYNPYTNSWMRLLPLENRCLWKIFAGNEDEIYALFCYACFPVRHMRGFAGLIDVCDKEHSLFISKYKPDSHSWEDVASLDNFHPNGKEDYCVVARDHLIYFISGVQFVGRDGVKGVNKFVYLSDVERYDLRNKQWDKVADIQVARRGAHGAAVNGKVFIAGGRVQDCKDWEWLYHSCEMYDETTDKWQFIASIKKPDAFNTILAADGKLYAMCCEVRPVASCSRECEFQQVTVECYDLEKNEWKVKSEITFSGRDLLHIIRPCSMRIFKGFSNIRPLETSSPDSPPDATTKQASQCKICNQRS